MGGPRREAEPEAPRDDPAWRGWVARVGACLGIVAGDALFDVGCGAGAFLGLWRDAGVRLGGLERSAWLAGLARAALPEADIDVGEPARLDVRRRYDVVLAHSAFRHVTSLDYASAVLARMTLKARRAIAVLDLPEQRLARDWFRESLRALGATRIAIEDRDGRYDVLAWLSSEAP